MEVEHDRVSVGARLDLELAGVEWRLLECRAKLKDVADVLGGLTYVVTVLANREMDRIVEENSNVRS